jgi:cyclic pyranopterin phosphate synthase
VTLADFTHLDEHGHAHMVNVTAKKPTARQAKAICRVVLADNGAFLDELTAQQLFIAAQSAAMQAAKRTPLLIPLCHPLSATAAAVSVERDGGGVTITSITETFGPTGVEMEALTACMVGALTIVAAATQARTDASIEGLTLLEKIGGKSGHWKNPCLSTVGEADLPRSS